MPHKKQRKWRSPKEISLSVVTRPLHVSALEYLTNFKKSKKQIKHEKTTQHYHKKAVEKSIENEKRYFFPDDLIIETNIQTTRKTLRSPDIINREKNRLIEVKTVPYIDTTWTINDIEQRYPFIFWKLWDYANQFPNYKIFELQLYARKNKVERTLTFRKEDFQRFHFKYLWGTAKQRKKELFRRIKEWDISPDPISYFYLGLTKYLRKRNLEEIIMNNNTIKKPIYKKKSTNNIDRTKKLSLIANDGETIAAIKVCYHNKLRKPAPVTKNENEVVLIALQNGQIKVNNSIRFVDNQLSGEMKQSKMIQKNKFTIDELYNHLEGERELFLYPGKYIVFRENKDTQMIEKSLLTNFPEKSAKVIITNTTPSKKKNFTVDSDAVMKSIEDEFILFNNSNQVQELALEELNKTRTKKRKTIKYDELISYVLTLHPWEQRNYIGVHFQPLPDDYKDLANEMEKRIF